MLIYQRVNLFFSPLRTCTPRSSRIPPCLDYTPGWLSCCSPHVFTGGSIWFQGFGASVQSRWQQLPPVPAGELQGQGLNATDDPWTKHFVCVKHFVIFPRKMRCFRHRFVWKIFSPEMDEMFGDDPGIRINHPPSAMCFLFLTHHSFVHYGSKCSNIFLG